MNRRVVIKAHRYGGAEVLRVVQEDVPDIGNDEVRIQTCYAGINFADLMARAGLYPGGPKPPFTPGLEVAGTIMDPGRFRDRFSSGDQIVALVPGFGGYTSVLNVSARYVRKLSDSADLRKAAGMPAAYLTAYMMLDWVKPIPGTTVLVHGAGGGVGTALIDLAGSKGLQLIGAASASKHRKLEALNLDLILDSGSKGFQEAIGSHTNGKGVDVIFDSRGPSAFQQSYELLAPFGSLVMYGVQNLTLNRRLSLRSLKTYMALLRMHFSPMKLMNENRGVFGFSLARLPDHPRSAAAFDEIVKLFEAGEISPIIDSVVPATEAAAAHRSISERMNVGKVLLDFTNAG